MDTLKTMLVRHSCRAYTDQQLTDEQLEKVLLAANAAPIGRALYENMHLTVIQNDSFIANCTEMFRTAIGDANANPLYNGKTWIIVSSKAEAGELAFANAACMVENMSLEATELGLGHVYIHGALRVLEKNPDFIKAIDIPEGFRPIASIILGYEKEPKTEERQIGIDRVATNYIK